MNLETGIHYGVIPKNDLFNCAEEFFNNAEDIDYTNNLKEIKENIKASIEDFMFDDNVKEILELIEEHFNENYQGDCALMRYERDGFIIEASNDDCDLFIIKSPFYTLAPPCSPCAPGAGYLRDGIKEDELDENGEVKVGSGGIETYCLPEDWFSEENPCPYKYWEVKENVSN